MRHNTSRPILDYESDSTRYILLMNCNFDFEDGIQEVKANKYMLV